MEFYCLGSGSSGNAYIFKSGNETILVECGLDYKKLCKKMMNEGITPADIKAVVCTHKHKDHIESIESWVNRGIKVVAPKDCFNEEAPNINCVECGSVVELTENIRTLAFPVNHDCDAYGYVFQFKDTKEKVLFINDTAYFDFPYKNQCFDYVFIECNHLRSKLVQVKYQKQFANKPYAKYERQEKYHMSLAALKKLLNDINLSKTKTIYLMHMSYECCDRGVCQRLINYNYDIETLVCGENGGFIKENIL